jgi:hypothetical protein
MRSEAITVEEYLSSLPADRRDAIAAVRAIILDNLPDGIVETMRWGMISYEVPLSVVPDTYNGEPLSFAALASQKNHMAVYLMAIYGDEALRAEFEKKYAASGFRLNAGKSCVRFTRLEKLPLDVIGWAVGAMTMADFIDLYEKSRSLRVSKASRKAAH